MSDRGQGNTPGPNQPWYLRHPDSDDRTSMARSQPNPPRTPPPAYRQPASGHDIPWYLQRPDRPVPAPVHEKPTAGAKDSRAVPWFLVAAGGVALLVGVAVLAFSIPKLAP